MTVHTRSNGVDFEGLHKHQGLLHIHLHLTLTTLTTIIAPHGDEGSASGGHFTHGNLPGNGGREHLQFCKSLQFSQDVNENEHIFLLQKVKTKKSESKFLEDLRYGPNPYMYIPLCGIV